jgi:hypothetical protein
VEFQRVHVGCDQAVMDERERPSASASFGRGQLLLFICEDCRWGLAQRVLYSRGHGERLSTTLSSFPLFLFFDLNITSENGYGQLTAMIAKDYSVGNKLTTGIDVGKDNL